MFRRIAQVACISAAFLVAGGHWAVLQSVAWFGMLTEYSGEHGMVSAVSKTFDGQNPCSLCKKVEEGRKQEGEKTPLVKAEKKADVFFSRGTPVEVIRTSAPLAVPPWRGETSLVMSANVPTPPPRA
jgi:hypothetical protein